MFGDFADLVAFGRRQVFGGGFAVSPGEEEAGKMGAGAFPEPIDFIGEPEGAPELLGAVEKFGGAGGEVDGFEQQVVKEKAGIEAGVAVVDDFKIDSHEGAVGGEEIFWTPVAVDERDAAGAAAFDECFEVGCAVRVAGGGEAVIRVEAEFVEDGLITELGFPDGILPGGADDATEGMAGGAGDGGIDGAAEEGGFPIGGGGRGGVHGVDAVFPVDEEDRGDGAGGEEGSDGLQRVGFAEGAFGAGAPIGFNAELFQRLLADDAAGGGFGEENGIGDSAAEGGDGGTAGTGPALPGKVGKGVVFR